MLLCVYTGLHTDWYLLALSAISEVDTFFSDQTDMIFKVLTVAFVCIGVFAVFMMCGYRWFLLESARKEMGIYLVTGYERKKLILPLVFDVTIDILVGFPLSRIIFAWVQKNINKEPIFLRLVQERGNMEMDNVVVGIVTLLMILSVMLVQTVMYVNGLKKVSVNSVIKGDMGL